MRRLPQQLRVRNRSLGHQDNRISSSVRTANEPPVVFPDAALPGTILQDVSAMAVMASALGIPSRVAIGYASGAYDERDRTIDRTAASLATLCTANFSPEIRIQQRAPRRAATTLSNQRITIRRAAGGKRQKVREARGRR